MHLDYPLKLQFFHRDTKSARIWKQNNQMKVDMQSVAIASLSIFLQNFDQYESETLKKKIGFKAVRISSGTNIHVNPKWVYGNRHSGVVVNINYSNPVQMLRKLESQRSPTMTSYP